MILMRGIGVPPLIKRHHRSRSTYTRARCMCRRAKIEVRVDTRRWYQSFQGAEDCRTAGFRLGLCRLGVKLGPAAMSAPMSALPESGPLAAIGRLFQPCSNLGDHRAFASVTRSDQRAAPAPT